jgi:hypothetical protein
MIAAIVDINHLKDNIGWDRILNIQKESQYFAPSRTEVMPVVNLMKVEAFSSITIIGPATAWNCTSGF